MTIEALVTNRLNIVMANISDQQCMCACPFHFQIVLIDPKNRIDNVSINNNKLVQTDEIFQHMDIIEKKNILSGIKTVNYYHISWLDDKLMLRLKKDSRQYNLIFNNKKYKRAKELLDTHLFQEKKYDKKNKLIYNKYYSNGKEID